MGLKKIFEEILPEYFENEEKRILLHSLLENAARTVEF